MLTLFTSYERYNLAVHFNESNMELYFVFFLQLSHLFLNKSKAALREILDTYIVPAVADTNKLKSRSMTINILRSGKYNFTLNLTLHVHYIVLKAKLYHT